MWNNLTGYVMIRVEGASPERLLNRMLQADIPVWNVRRQGNDMLAEMRAKDFARVHPLRRGLRCRVHVAERHGVPFLLARARFRKGLVFGLALGAMLILLAQTRVWAIRVEGLYQVPEAVVQGALVQQGVNAGMARRAVEPLALSEAIRAYDDRIAWAGAHLDGVALFIRIVEAEPVPELPDKSLPADVVAGKDGIIRQVTALNGKPAVQPGDAVRKGDLLVRGDITREGAAEQLLVHAEGEVMAEVIYIAEVTLPGTRRALARSGRETAYRALHIAGYPVYKSAAGFEQYELAEDSAAVMRGLVIPVRYARGAYYELIETEVEAEREELIAEALFLAEMKANWMVPKDSRMLEKKSEARWGEDGSITAVATIITLEQIGKSSPMLNAGRSTNIQEN